MFELVLNMPPDLTISCFTNKYMTYPHIVDVYIRFH